MMTIRSAGARILFTSAASDLRAALVAAVAAGVNLACANLRGADLAGAGLREAYLRDAILEGANLACAGLRDADLRNAKLERADLRGADLARADLRGAILRGAILGGANLSRANLSRANLRDANLRDANLRDANLEGADLRGAILGDIPIVHRLHRQILDAIEAGGRLDMGSWHKCETTHCRAGWAIHLAGPAGYELEERLGPATAGALITAASCPRLDKSPDFHASTAEALANIRRCAKREETWSS